MEIKLKYTPTGKQKLFHTCPADEVLFGGAAGGGKSTALVMDVFFTYLSIKEQGQCYLGGPIPS